ncbi:melanocyte-stimulating hormone receptor-like [Acropora palmata]|uniref:melanocyte-stimulating hormone receptor-like n=1 Tax=Acropora palmata TaxID=6131 RepID=UPI003DA155EC
MENVTEVPGSSSYYFHMTFCNEEITSGGNNHAMLIVVLNVFFSGTASVGNAIILVALQRESSLYPPTKVLLRCLATSDLFVGLFAEPFRIARLLSILRERWVICQYTSLASFICGYALASVSLLTVTAISLDRFLALRLGLIYRQVVTLKRSILVVVAIWVVSIVSSLMYFWSHRITLWYGYTVISLSLVVTTFAYTTILFSLRQRKALRQDNQDVQVPALNIARYKKAVSSSLWVLVTLCVCHLPFALIDGLFSQREASQPLFISRAFSVTLLYLNSSLNPILYCWKITEVRKAVKDLIGKLFCCFGNNVNSLVV